MLYCFLLCSDGGGVTREGGDEGWSGVEESKSERRPLRRTRTSSASDHHLVQQTYHQRTMKVVCLLSGGKDSVYNLIHSIINDHTPLALASLAPPPLRGTSRSPLRCTPELTPACSDEIDSYMYQTVGHSGLATIAQALNLPLFTHEIKGTAVNQEGEYGQREGGKGKGTEGDETEDMYELLNKVKVRFMSASRRIRDFRILTFSALLRVRRLLCPRYKV